MQGEICTRYRYIPTESSKYKSCSPDYLCIQVCSEQGPEHFRPKRLSSWLMLGTGGAENAGEFKCEKENAFTHPPTVFAVWLDSTLPTNPLAVPVLGAGSPVTCLLLSNCQPALRSTGHQLSGSLDTC